MMLAAAGSKWRKSRARDWREISQGPGQLHAGRTSAHDDEGQQRPPFVRIRFALRPLEREEHAAAYFERILERLQARRGRLPSSWPKYAWVAPAATIA